MKIRFSLEKLAEVIYFSILLLVTLLVSKKYFLSQSIGNIIFIGFVAEIILKIMIIFKNENGKKNSN